MPTRNLTRNLRDGQLVISDGTTPTPLSVTLALDEGDLSWTINRNTIQVRDRGVLSHTRKGDDGTVDLSFSAKWVELLGLNLNTPIDETLYEIVNDEGGSFTSTSADGEQYTLEFAFTVVDPAEALDVADETITFAKCYMNSFTCAEGDEYSTMSYSGTDFETKPTISRENDPTP